MESKIEFSVCINDTNFRNRFFLFIDTATIISKISFLLERQITFVLKLLAFGTLKFVEVLLYKTTAISMITSED